MFTPNRRGFLGGLIALVAAPAVVRATSIMPVRTPLVPIRNVLVGPEGAGLFYLDADKNWQSIGAVESIGEFGPVDVTFDDMFGGQRVVRGVRNAGLMRVTHELTDNLPPGFHANSEDHFWFNMEAGPAFEFKAKVTDIRNEVEHSKNLVHTKTDLDLTSGITEHPEHNSNGPRWRRAG